MKPSQVSQVILSIAELAVWKHGAAVKLVLAILMKFRMVNHNC